MKEMKKKRENPRSGINRRIAVTAGVMAELLNYLLVAVFACVVIADMAKENPDWKSICFLGVVPLFCYLFRVRVHHFIPFVLFHLLPVAGIIIFYQGSVVQKTFLFLIAAFFSAGSILKRIRSDRREMEAALPPAAIGIFWVLYLIDSSQGSGKLGRYLLYAAIGFVAGYFVYYFLKQFLHYIDVNNRTTENIPVNHVFYSAAGLAGGFVCAMTVITVAVSNRELLDEVGVRLRRMLAGCIAFLFSLFPKGSTQMGMTVDTRSGIGMPEIAWTAPEKSLFMEIMDILLCVAAAAIFVLAAVKLTIMAVRVIRSGFADKKKERLIKNGIYEDKVESLKREKKEQKQDKGSFVRRRIERLISPDEKIRKIYRKTLERSVTSGEEEKTVFLQKATARECCAAFFPGNVQEAAAFADIYEKARYGKRACDGEDVKKAKRLSSLLQRKR